MRATCYLIIHNILIYCFPQLCSLLLCLYIYTGAELVGTEQGLQPPLKFSIIYILLTISDNEKVKETRAWACGTMEADSDSEKVKMKKKKKKKNEATWTRNVAAFTIFSIFGAFCFSQSRVLFVRKKMRLRLVLIYELLHRKIDK